MNLFDDGEQYQYATEEDKQHYRNFLHDILTKDVVQVHFEKKDGTIRVMNCTLKSDLVTINEKKTERTRAINPDQCVVYDVDINEWRSFRYDSIKHIEEAV